MRCIDQAQNIWAHVICVNWTPEIYFTDEKKNKITGQLNLERFNLTCHHCLKRNKGSSIQCDYQNCKVSRHVRCSVHCGMIFQWDKMEQLVSKNYITDGEYDMPVFCEKHRVIGSLAFRDGGKQSLQEIQKTKKNAKPLTAEQKQAQELRLQRWKENTIVNLQGPGFFQKINKIKDLVDNKYKPKSYKKFVIGKRGQKKILKEKKKLSIKRKIITKAPKKSSGFMTERTSVMGISSSSKTIKAKKGKKVSKKIVKKVQKKTAISQRAQRSSSRVRHFKKGASPAKKQQKKKTVVAQV